MARPMAESPFAAQIIVLPPFCPSLFFLRSLRPHSPPLSVTLRFQGLHQSRLAGNESIPQKGVRSKTKRTGVQGLGVAD
eukprot:2650174-Pyramimonas_sp.AAC.1